MTTETVASGVNRNRPDRWKEDILKSVDMFNSWFMEFAPSAYRKTRIAVTADVIATLHTTANLTNISIAILSANPGILPTLRMATCPPIAVDRLVGLAGISKSLVGAMETGRLPSRILAASLESDLMRIATIIERMADPDIFVWLGRDTPASEIEVHRAATVVADRLCGSVANPIIRNAQEKRQLDLIESWLISRGYERVSAGVRYHEMAPGAFSFHMNVPVKLTGGLVSINIPVDAVVMPLTSAKGDMPLLIEAKSAGDFTNVNKRRKEEAVKMAQFHSAYGPSVRFILFLCGYFDSGYLGYEAAEGIDWVWEHRIDELAEFGI